MKRITILTIILLSIPMILLAQENNPINCGDGIDNDGDGLIDCLDTDCQGLPNDGCLTCTDGISFADTLFEYISGCDLSDPDPMGAIGISDWGGGSNDQPEFVFLGQGGTIKLGFVNNILINSGDSNPDLWVFEIGPDVESSNLALRPLDNFTLTQLQSLNIPDINSDGYYEVGNISGSTSSFDIDNLLPNYSAGELKFDAIEIMDVEGGSCSGDTPGADIDAVCALSSIEVVSVDNPLINNQIKVHPNPSFNEVFISWSDKDFSFFNYFIIDMNGKIVEEGNVENENQIDLSKLQSGTYILRMVGEKKVGNSKIIKI